MKLNSKYFDRIRIKPDRDQPRPEDMQCEWPGCAQRGAFRAPKGRNAEGQYFQFCMDHVRAYNKSYNYFDGMGDNDIGNWIKSAQTGHRPTWKLGENSWAENRRTRDRKSAGGTAGRKGFRHDPDFKDPHTMFAEHAEAWRGRARCRQLVLQQAENQHNDKPLVSLILSLLFHLLAQELLLVLTNIWYLPCRKQFLLPCYWFR